MGRNKHCFQCGLDGFISLNLKFFKLEIFFAGKPWRRTYFLTSTIIILPQPFEATYGPDNVSFQCNLLESVKLNICHLLMYSCKMVHNCVTKLCNNRIFKVLLRIKKSFKLIDFDREKHVLVSRPTQL